MNKEECKDSQVEIQAQKPKKSIQEKKIEVTIYKGYLSLKNSISSDTFHIGC